MPRAIVDGDAALDLRERRREVAGVECYHAGGVVRAQENGGLRPRGGQSSQLIGDVARAAELGAAQVIAEEPDQGRQDLGRRLEPRRELARACVRAFDLRRRRPLRR